MTPSTLTGECSIEDGGQAAATDSEQQVELSVVMPCLNEQETVGVKARSSIEAPGQSLTRTEAPSVAVLIPCHNEAAAVAGVVAEFRRFLPDAEIYVYDNNSRDQTGIEASRAGAHVRHEMLRGKGNVVRRMFSDVEADIYVLVDGDGTYDPASAPEMIRMLLQDRLDMVNGARVSRERAAYRRGHRTGNLILSGLVGWVFGDRINDMLSGYRIFSRRFVKSFPALSSGFEIETELTVHALELRVPLGEMEIQYRERIEGGDSKLRTYSDGLRIVRTIVWLIKQERPLQFFSIAALVLFVLAITLSIPILVQYHLTGMVPRFPTAILSMGIVLLSFLSLACGLILDSVAVGRKESKRMAYLSIPYLTAAKLSNSTNVETKDGCS